MNMIRKVYVIIVHLYNRTSVTILEVNVEIDRPICICEHIQLGQGKEQDLNNRQKHFAQVEQAEVKKKRRLYMLGVLTFLNITVGVRSNLLIVVSFQ